MKKIDFVSILKTLIAFFSGAAVCILIIVFFAKNPSNALKTLFLGTFSSKYYFGTMLNTASLLMISGTGAAIGLKSGNMNLGGEGQIYAGAYAGTFVLVSVNAFSDSIVFLLALFAALFTGALMTSLSALLKKIRKAEVLLTSFLISAATIPFVDSLISQNQLDGNLLSLPYIKESFRFKSILPPSSLSVILFFAIALCILSFCFLHYSQKGRELQLWGIAPEFARFSGFNEISSSTAALLISGMLHALTGFFAVCGTFYTCHKGFYSGMGWNALSASLIVCSNPIALIFAAILLSWLYTSADLVGLTQGFSFDISGIVQGCILFAIALAFNSREKK